jgi:hypothetical protein
MIDNVDGTDGLDWPRSQVGRMLPGVLLILPCCSTMRIGAQQAPGADFSRYQVFAWAGPAPQTGDVRLDDPRLDARIRELIQLELIAKGYAPADGPTADFRISYQAAIERNAVATRDPGGKLEAQRGWGPGLFTNRKLGQRNEYVEEWDEGTLIVDAIDEFTGATVWRGYVKAELRTNPDPAVRDRRLREAIRSVLKRFPSAKKQRS